MEAPLAGIRVLDLTRVLAGPWCTQLLADLGADVIKIENPEGGDDTRSWGPPWLKDRDGEDTGEAAYYLAANRGKRSVTLDLKSEAGLAAAKELAAVSDVMIENFKVGGLAKLGLGAEAMRALNPRLIYASITGFGQTGPMKDQPGYDYLIQALGGLMSITGQPDGEPGAGPQRVGVAVSDLTTGLYAVIGILAALHMRARTGQGQHLDLALLDVQVGWLSTQAMNYLIGGKVPRRTGAWHPNLAPYQPFAAADGEVVIAVGNNRQFRSLCGVLGLPEMPDDPRFRDNPSRNVNRAEMIPPIARAVLEKPRAHWLAALPAAGVPCSGLNDIAQAFDEPQVKARGMRIELDHPLAGTMPAVANPLKLSGAEVGSPMAPPLLGQHSEEVLREVLGWDEARILAATGG